MSGWLQALSEFCIFNGECTHLQSINNPFHKLALQCKRFLAILAVSFSDATFRMMMRVTNFQSPFI